MKATDERNQTIIALHLAGVSLRAISAHCTLSHTGVRRIIKENEQMSDHPVVEDDHSAHWTTHPETGERVEEASVTVDGQRIYWCGHTEPIKENTK